MEKVDRPVLERRKIALELRPHARGGERVVELVEVGVALGGSAILAGVDLTVLRGERVGRRRRQRRRQVGAAARARAASSSRPEGERKAGPSIRFGRLAQDRRPDDPNATPLELVRRAAPISEGEAVSRLMKFLFSLRAGAAAAAHALGRRVDAAAAAAADARGCELPAARRADEPPRHRVRRDARGGARSRSTAPRLRLARPLLPRPHRRSHPRGVRRRACVRSKAVGRTGAGARRRVYGEEVSATL